MVLGNSMRSGDWICPRCKQMQYAQKMNCRNCGHGKPTLNTMGQACWDYYPLAGERRKCEGEQHCPECHGIIHRSHSECLGCRERRMLAEQANAAPSGPVMLALPGGRSRLALAPAPPKEKTEYEALCDKYAGMDPVAVLEDLERLKKNGGKAEPQQAPEETQEAKAAKEALERTRAENEAREKERQLKAAQAEAARLEEERGRKRDAAAARIQAMLEEDERAAAASPGQSSPGAVEAPGPASPGTAAVVEGGAARARTAEEEEERRQKRARLRQQREEEEEEKRRRQRERRQQRVVVL